MQTGAIKYFFFIMAALIALGSLFYTWFLVGKLSESEKQRIELWSEAYREIQRVDINQQISPVVLKIIQSNNYIPVIMCDDSYNIIAYANLDSNKINDSTYLYRQLDAMKSSHEPIVIDLGDGVNYYLYYRDSRLLTQLFYYPIFQLAVVTIFLLVVYFAARSTKKAEEHLLWIAMSKETAHQLGTPLSSLIAWIEMLKMFDLDRKLITEVEKDIKRLEKITDRFSKIGQQPELQPVELQKVIQDAVNYLKRRSPSRIKYSVNFDTERPLIVNLNISLFEWVIENLAKNAIDAMSGEGEIIIDVKHSDNVVTIDFKDPGKGISTRNLNQIFKPGYTTKKHGWGMGLALVKRIIENYHGGKIFVVETSEKGTTFRIILNR